MRPEIESEGDAKIRKASRLPERPPEAQGWREKVRRFFETPDIETLTDQNGTSVGEIMGKIASHG